MRSCFKCGKDTPEGVAECPFCAEGYMPNGYLPGVDEDEDDAYFKKHFMEVDWEKVKTLEDVIALLKACGEVQYIPKDSDEFARVEKFLRPIQD